jgi:hypothetical protein
MKNVQRRNYPIATAPIAFRLYANHHQFGPDFRCLSPGFGPCRRAGNNDRNGEQAESGFFEQVTRVPHVHITALEDLTLPSAAKN